MGGLMYQDNMQLEQLMELLGLGGAAPKFTPGPNAYFGGLQRKPYQGDPRFMPQPPQQGMPQPPMPPMGMPPMQGMAPPAAPAQGMPMDPAMMQMLGGMGLG